MMAVNLISLTNCQYTGYSLVENKLTPPLTVSQCNRLSMGCTRIVLTLCTYYNLRLILARGMKSMGTRRQTPFWNLVLLLWHKVIFVWGYREMDGEPCCCLLPKSNQMLTSKNWWQPSILPRYRVATITKYLLLLIFAQFRSWRVCSCSESGTDDINFVHEASLPIFCNRRHRKENTTFCSNHMFR